MQGWRRTLIVLALMAAGALPALAQPAPAYRLSEAELAPFRKEVERTSSVFDLKVHALVQHGSPFRRVIANIADKRGGRYSGNNWSILQTFEAYFELGPESQLAYDRYIVMTGCRRHSCPEKAAAIIDLKTGQVAFALLHYSNAAGKDFERAAGLTRFMKACTGRELRAFAETRFVLWARAELEELGGQVPGGFDEREVETLTTRC